MKMRKILSLLVSVALVIGLVSIPAFAADDEEVGVIYNISTFEGLKLTGDSQYVDGYGIQRMGWTNAVYGNFTGSTIAISDGILQVRGGTTAKGVQFTKDYANTIMFQGTVGVEYKVVLVAAAASTAGIINVVPDNHDEGVAQTFELPVAETTFELQWVQQQHQYNSLQISSDVDFDIYSITIYDVAELPEEDADEDEDTDEDGEEVDGEYAPDMANFAKTKTYANDFSDIPAGYEKWIEGAFEYGIIAGIGGGKFGTGTNLTIEQAIIIAAKMHAIYAYGDKSVIGSDNIAYAKAEGLIGDEFDAVLKNNATRAEMIYIWSNILLPEDMEAQNEFIAIPDVDETNEYYDAIKLAYEVGLLKGVDASGSFNPDGNILREHAAVIFMKLVDVESRSSGYTYDAEAPEETEEEEPVAASGGINVFSPNFGDSWGGANIILGSDESVWPFSNGVGDDGTSAAAFTPEKDVTYRLTFTVTTFGWCDGFRVRWLKDNANGSYTAGDTAIVNDHEKAADEVATVIPAYFKNTITEGETKTYVVEFTMDGAAEADGTIGNIAIRGQSGANDFEITSIVIENVATGEVMAEWVTP